MDANPLLGVALHALGGLMSATFYVPFRGVRRWSWETYWLVGGVFSWLLAPWVLALATVPDLTGVLYEAPRSSLLWCYLFGATWGVGGLCFGLTMRYLGLSLGNALALGFCAAFGTLMPPIFSGEIHSILADHAGHVVLLGIAVCLGGIFASGLAGVSKEREMTAGQKSATIKEFSFARGVVVAVLAGVLSASMSYGVAAGKPIAALAVQRGTAPLWQNTPVFVVILAGGLTTNFLWCVALHIRNRSATDYFDRSAPLLRNYLLSALAGSIWYLQFMFYGMGNTQMGRYEFSSWTLHMASIMTCGTLWGFALGEWSGSSRRTVSLVGLGLMILVAATVIVGYGNYLAAAGAPAG
jgi:L-rhamnose-H+ transport protein